MEIEDTEAYQMYVQCREREEHWYEQRELAAQLTKEEQFVLDTIRKLKSFELI